MCLFLLLQLEKGETLPKLADLLINELFVVQSTKENLSPQRWKVRCDSFATEHANGQ